MGKKREGYSPSVRAAIADIEKTLARTSLPEVTKCWLVIQYRTYEQRWLRAVCTTPESAELQKLSVQISIESGHRGCEPDDKVFVEETLLDHLYGHGMKF